MSVKAPAVAARNAEAAEARARASMQDTVAAKEQALVAAANARAKAEYAATETSAVRSADDYAQQLLATLAEAEADDERIAAQRAKASGALSMRRHQRSSALSSAASSRSAASAGCDTLLSTTRSRGASTSRSSLASSRRLDRHAARIGRGLHKPEGGATLSGLEYHSGGLNVMGCALSYDTRLRARHASAASGDTRVSAYSSRPSASPIDLVETFFPPHASLRDGAGAGVPRLPRREREALHAAARAATLQSHGAVPQDHLPEGPYVPPPWLDYRTW